MHCGIGRTCEFPEEDRSKHRFEWFRIVPIRKRIVLGIQPEVEVADHLDRIRRFVKYLVGLPRQVAPSAGKRIDILESLVNRVCVAAAFTSRDSI